MVTKVQLICYYADALGFQCRCGSHNDPTHRSLCTYDETRLLVPYSSCSVLGKPTGHFMNSSDILCFLSYIFVSQTRIIESYVSLFSPILVLAHFKALSCDRSRAGIASSNPTKGVDIYLLVNPLCCHVTDDPSYSGLLPNVACLSAVRCNINPLHLQ